MKHINIPIFIPHLGCPNQCVFCNQRSISGVSSFDPANVTKIIDEALTTIPVGSDVEIAFFGGSFTGIDRTLMMDLLSMAYRYVERGAVSHIRCSTRPDYIDEDVLEILRRYGVRVIELGLQSTSENVLMATKRGHDFSSEVRACQMIVDGGFDLVGQMMIGLPQSTLEDELETARFIIGSGAVGARIYPTVVFNETELCQLARDGKYTPLELDEAVLRSASVLKLFLDAGIEVIRIGLCASENLSSVNTYFAGPNHAAIGELVENRIYYENITEKIKNKHLDAGDVLKIYVKKGCLSKAIGQKKKNKFLLTKALNTENIVFCENDDIAPYEASVVVERKR